MTEFSTKISQVMPGKVTIRGYSHADIIGNLSYAEATYLTIVGELPTPAQARMMDAMLTSLLDHGFVAATVSATRYAASGNPQFIPAVASGLLASGSNTLSPEHSFKIIDECLALQAEGMSLTEAAAEVVARRRAAGIRIPGLGHPTHKTSDFRADRLFAIADSLGITGEATTTFRAIHEEFLKVSSRKDIPINVDACLACLGRDLGLSAMQTVSIAVLAVLPGLMAHAIEEIDEGKPLRFITDDEYTGVPERPLPVLARDLDTAPAGDTSDLEPQVANHA